MGKFRKVLFWSAGQPGGAVAEPVCWVGEMESKAISASNLKLKLTEAELIGEVAEVIKQVEPEPHSDDELGDLAGRSPGGTGNDGEAWGKDIHHLGLFHSFMVGTSCRY